MRVTTQTDAKAGVSDPLTRRDCGQGLTDKSYLGDNRLVAPESSYRRRGSAPFVYTLGRHESNLKLVIQNLNWVFLKFILAHNGGLLSVKKGQYRGKPA